MGGCVTREELRAYLASHKIKLGNAPGDGGKERVYADKKPMRVHAATGKRSRKIRM